MRRIAAALPLVVLAVAGCGQAAQTDDGVDDFRGEEKAVAQVIADLAEDGRNNEPGDICDDLISSSLTDRITSAGTKCATEMRKAIEDADGFDLTVKDVNVTGATATAEVEGTDRGKKITQTFTLRREGDDWKIEKFAT
jgi:hypothetical protein